MLQVSDQLLIYKTMTYYWYPRKKSVRLSVSVTLVCFVLVGNIVNSYKALWALVRMGSIYIKINYVTCYKYSYSYSVVIFSKF